MLLVRWEQEMLMPMMFLAVDAGDGAGMAEDAIVHHSPAFGFRGPVNRNDKAMLIMFLLFTRAGA